MVHFIRSFENRTIIECEVIAHKNDLSAAVNIREFVSKMKELHKWDQDDFAEDIACLAEIRGWWWEQAEDSGQYASIDEFVAEKFKAVVDKYNHDDAFEHLIYVTD